jgi:hypothetical protein
MRANIFLVTFLTCIAAATTIAQAREVKFTEDGDAVLTVQIPDEWTAAIDAERNMQLMPADKSWGILLSIAAYSGALDDAASGIMKSAGATPPTRRDSATMAGMGGYAYYATMVVNNNQTLNLKDTLVKIDDQHVASVVVLTRATDPGGTVAMSEAIVRTVQISGGASGSK